MSLLSNTISYVNTPRGTRVTVYSNSEFSSSEIINYNRIADAYFASDIRISNASRKYNNFSYTFYKICI